jgi:putative ABC transport system permease protein
MITQYAKLAIKNIKKRKLRSWLTLLGIFISIAAIFILVSLSLGLREAITEQFELLGADKIFIQANGNFGAPGSETASKLTTGDLDAIKKVSGVKEASYMVMGNVKVDYHNEIKYLMIIGVPLEGLALYMEGGQMKITDGRNIEKEGKNEIIVGYDFKYNSLFESPVSPNDKIILNDITFKVTGIISRVGNPSDDKTIILTIEDFKKLSDSGNRADYLIVKTEEGEDVNEVAKRLEKKLMSFRNVNEKTIDFTVLTPEELMSSFSTILTIITVFLISIASISLVVGAIGIANTMYTSVIERTREIGVMKAIGAKNSDILSIFVIEAGFIGMAGGVIGVLFGLFVVKIIEYIAINQINTTLLRAVTPFYLIFGCIFFSFLIGVISGFMPARSASKLKTVDALRYE